jgi:hypothetical protein
MGVPGGRNNMDRHELAALKTERLEAQRAAKIEDALKKASSKGQHTAAPSPWLRHVNEYARRERCEFQVTRYG